MTLRSHTRVDGDHTSARSVDSGYTRPRASARLKARRLRWAVRRTIVYPHLTLGRATIGIVGGVGVPAIAVAAPHAVAAPATSPLAGFVAGAGDLLSAALTLAVLVLLFVICCCLALGRTGPAIGLSVAVFAVAIFGMGALNVRWDAALVAGPIGSPIVSLSVLLLVLCGIRVMVTGQFTRRRRHW